MDTVNEIALEFLKVELNKAQIKILHKESGKETIDFIIKSINGKSNTLFFKTINTNKKLNIKILKQDLDKLKDNLFVALVLIIDKGSKVFYLISSKELSQADSNIFTENNVSLMPSLLNWEIKVSANNIPELAKYAIENMIDKLKV